MKKFIFLSLFAIIAMAFVMPNKAEAQSTTPRYGTAKNQDNTGRILTYGYTTLTDAAGADSATINPNSWKTVYRVALTDSLYMNSPVVTRSYAGDEVSIVASGASGKLLKFAGTNWIGAGTATLSTGGRAVITFVFDGAKYVEKSRVVQ